MGEGVLVYIYCMGVGSIFCKQTVVGGVVYCLGVIYGGAI